ncbi:MAG: hypothetical protein HC825_00355 [Oscillatoriales cyanobacterium RM1_1_9]|nr:hypothetical protein [Oscillatoriales cyanobacterium RM1_1_9]
MTQVTNNNTSDYGPDISGGNIAWTGTDPVDFDSEICCGSRAAPTISTWNREKP